MQRQKFRAELVLGLRDAFALLLEAAARQRWASSLEGSRQPTVGLHYVSRDSSRLRCGRIVECLRPVALTLAEVLLEPPGHVRLRLRYRLEPSQRGTLVQLDAGQELNAAACLRKRYWTAEVGRECAALLGTLEGLANGPSGRDGLEWPEYRQQQHDRHEHDQREG